MRLGTPSRSTRRHYPSHWPRLWQRPACCGWSPWHTLEGGRSRNWGPWPCHARGAVDVAGFLLRAGLQRQGSMSRAKSWSILEFDEVWQEKCRTKISCMNYIHKMQMRHAAVTYRVCLQQVCHKEGWWSWSSVKWPSRLSESAARLRGICAPFRLLLISRCLKSSVHMYKRNKTWLPQSERIHDTNNSFQHWFSPLTPRNPTPHQPTPEPSILCKTICKVPRKSRCQNPTPTFPRNRNAKLRSCMCPSS